MEFEGEDVLRRAILEKFEEKLTEIIDSGQCLMYSSVWYRGIVEAVISAGGTLEDLKKVEDNAMGNYFKPINKLKSPDEKSLSVARM